VRARHSERLPVVAPPSAGATFPAIAVTSRGFPNPPPECYTASVRSYTELPNTRWAGRLNEREGI